ATGGSALYCDLARRKNAGHRQDGLGPRCSVGHLAVAVRYTTEPRCGCPPITLRFGDQADARPVRHGSDLPGTGQALNVQAVANYIAKYATKALDAAGIPDRPIRSRADITALRCHNHYTPPRGSSAAARYRGPDGKLRSAPNTFARKSDAARWLTLKEAEIARGDWLDPDAARVPFADYAEQWIHDRVLKVRTQELYLGLLHNHLLPTFGSSTVADIDEAAVGRWRKNRLDAGPNAARPFGPVTFAKAYRLLHAILATAADDQ